MHFPVLIQDLAVILGVAAVITFIFRLIKQPVVLGYIVAGIIVGPYTPAIFSVADTENIKVWAELGVIFLMFTLGLEFSFRRLARVGMSAGVTGMLQIVAMFILGLFCANALGWTNMDAVFLGAMIAISSTTIIIKALEELGLKSKKFSELVFGILIVEDLAAILMLVALTNIVTTSQFGGMQLLFAGGKLAVVVGIWFLVGMFVVPRFVRSVSRHGNDEMLTVVAIGLCLALVALAAYFHYSVALGAFIMGSVIAESVEAKRIEHLVQPLKDIFGAVFFVSVGMLLNPATIIDNFGAVFLISIVIIVGKLITVTVGAFLTGQTLRSALQTGFSMAQIGEFSFIIASLGMAYSATSEKLYPIIVAASLITTFTTPYLIRASIPVADFLDRNLPTQIKSNLDSYVAWVQRRAVSSDRRTMLYKGAIKWSLNAILVITLFTVAAARLIPIIEGYFENEYFVRGLTWITAFALASPSIWAMLTTFRVDPDQSVKKRTFPQGGLLLLSRIATVGLVGILSIEYFPAPATLGVTVGVCGLVFIFFRRQIESYYRWLEDQFQSGFQADLGKMTHEAGMPTFTQDRDQPHSRLAPWDAHLVEIQVPARSFLVGKSLLELKLREKYGLIIVVIVRQNENIVAPSASEPLYPGDGLFCFATDAEVELFKRDIKADGERPGAEKDLNNYEMKKLKVAPRSKMAGNTIRTSGIREEFGCIVVGLERHGERIRSPSSEIILAPEDLLWVVGETKKLQVLAQTME